MPRKATHADIDQLFTLEATLFPDNCFNERTLGKLLDAGSGWVYEDEGDLLGYLLAQPDGQLLDVIRLGVQEGYRQLGVGSKLLEKALETTTSTMLCVKKDNEAALALYFKHGFRIVGILQADQGWVMKR